MREDLTSAILPALRGAIRKKKAKLKGEQKRKLGIDWTSRFRSRNPKLLGSGVQTFDHGGGWDDAWHAERTVLLKETFKLGREGAC